MDHWYMIFKCFIYIRVIYLQSIYNYVIFRCTYKFYSRIYYSIIFNIDQLLIALNIISIILKCNKISKIRTLSWDWNLSYCFVISFNDFSKNFIELSILNRKYLVDSTFIIKPDYFCKKVF